MPSVVLSILQPILPLSCLCLGGNHAYQLMLPLVWTMWTLDPNHTQLTLRVFVIAYVLPMRKLSNRQKKVCCSWQANIRQPCPTGKYSSRGFSFGGDFSFGGVYSWPPGLQGPGKGWWRTRSPSQPFVAIQRWTFCTSCWLSSCQTQTACAIYESYGRFMLWRLNYQRGGIRWWVKLGADPPQCL